MNSLTPLDLQEGGNGDEINIILNGQTFGPFKFRNPSLSPVEVEASKVFTDLMTVRVSEDDYTFNDPIGQRRTFDCEVVSGTVDFNDSSAHYRMSYTIEEV